MVGKLTNITGKNTNFNKYTIGIILTYSPITNQLIQYIEDLNKYTSVKCTGIVLDEELSNHAIWFKKNCMQAPLLSLHAEEYEKLKIYDVIIIPESNKTIFEYIPDTVIKVGLPHGTDVGIESTFCRYGGGFYFDYILGALEQPTLQPEKYINLFPAIMRRHKYPFVCEIPFGFPKLDRFFNTVTRRAGNKDAIIYHISLLSVEEYWVGDIIFDTLKTLLDSFPNRKITFRVHHFNKDDPKIINCIRMGNKYNNFFYSDHDSYIDDYANGAVMVTHREYYNHLFDSATGQPTVLYRQETAYNLHYEHDERYFTANETNFVSILTDALNAHFDTSSNCRSSRCLTAGIFNPGTSLDYFVSNLKHIVKGQILPEWTLYRLNEGSLDGCNFKLRQMIISGKPFSQFAMAYSVMTQYSALSLLLLADSFIRNTSIKEYYYPEALKYFYQLLHHNEFNLVSEEAQIWWENKGILALDLCNDAIEKNQITSTHEITWLNKHHHTPKDKIAQFSCNNKTNLQIFNLFDGKSISKRNIIIFGAGVFSEMIIKWNNQVDLFSPIVIIDNDKSKHNTLLDGIPIVPITELKNYNHDILICSQGSLVEIIDILLLNYNFKHKIYGFTINQIDASLFKLAIRLTSNSD